MPSRRIGTVTMADYELIPQEAIDKLVANPTVAPAFNSMFGMGRAEEMPSSGVIVCCSFTVHSVLG